MDVKQEAGVAGFLDPKIKMEEKEEDSADSKEKLREDDVVLLKTSGRSRGDVDHEMKQESKGETSKNWDAQLQEFLKTLQTPDSIGETSQQPETKQCSDPKMDPVYSKAIIDINTCCKELWVSPQQSHHIGDVEQDCSTHLNAKLLRKEKERTLSRNPAKAELQRQRFRMLSYEEARSPRDLCWQLQEYCCQWLEPERHTKEQMLELVTLEQFLAILPLDMQSWVKESSPETCAQVVTLAEEFLRRQPEGKIRKLQVAKFSEEPSANSLKAMKALLGKEKLHILTEKERGCNGNENMSIGDRCHSENQERKPLVDSIEQTEQPILYVKRDRESDFVYQEEKEASENQHKAESRNGESKATGLDQLIQSQGVSEGIGLPTTQEDKKEVKYDKSGGKCHLIIHQDPEVLEEEPYRCWHCGESFGSSVKLVTHERTHVGEKLYKCSCCGESERTHTGQKPHKCSHCGNTFGCTPQERIPGEEKSYTCSECGTSCSQRSHLLQHRRTHTVEPKKEQEDHGESVEKPREIKIEAEEESAERPREIKREREEEDPPQTEDPRKKQRLMMETRSVRTESLKPEPLPQEPCGAPSDCPSFFAAKNLQVTAAKQEEYASALIYLLGADFINRHGESGRFVYSLRRKRVAARQTWMPGWVHYKCQKLILFHCAESRKKPKRKLERFHLGNISKRLAIHQRECAPIELCPCLTNFQQIHVHRIVHDWAHQYEYVAQPGNSQPGRSQQPQGEEPEG